MKQKRYIKNRDPKTGRNMSTDLSGLVIGKLTIIAYTGRKCIHGYKIWSALCECGEVIERPSYRFSSAEGRRIPSSCPKCAPKGRPRLPNNASHIKSIWNKVRRSAFERNLEFDLSVDEVRTLCEGACSYCGIKPIPRVVERNLAGLFAYNGIDRIDSDVGYINSNVTSCCANCNGAKSDMTLVEFRQWAKRLYKHMFSGKAPVAEGLQESLSLNDRTGQWHKPKINNKKLRGRQMEEAGDKTADLNASFPDI